MAVYNSYDSYNDSYYHSAQIEPPISQSSNEPTFYNLFDYPPPCYLEQVYDSEVGYFANAPYRSNFYEFPQLIERETVNHGAYGYAISYSANACSAPSFTVPKVIEYDPDFYSEVSTQFVISYSVSEFNETEFEEYDPTPYGGGYDISETYGKPLQPSTEICYPPSSSSPPTATAIPIFTIPKEEEPPKGKIEEQTKPSSEIKPTQIEKVNHSSSSESDTASESEEIEEVKAIQLADPGIEYGNGREANQFPSGYGLEAMDLCESLFGYWPCLSRVKKQTPCRQPKNGCGRCHGHCYCYGNYGNQWQTAAEYLFGSHNPYPDGRGEGDAVYGYQRQIQGEPVYGYVWLNQNDFNGCEDV
ncbi:uncharacterized protein LOC120083862 [Benincasa hispida]|uniref:uncharacterized protein LOC120083862 n=1 Tax=Benincasa hispida TaxID=102211 RepID=UPI0018FFA4F3|nr:uncharacterized protein LOC120083862 [Benincasa hispida]